MHGDKTGTEGKPGSVTQALFARFGVLLVLMLFISVPAVNGQPAGSSPSSAEIVVELKEGRITLRAARASLASVLAMIGKKGECDIIVQGTLPAAPASWSIVDMEPVDAVRRLVGSRNMAVLYGNASRGRTMPRIWVYGRGRAVSGSSESSGAVKSARGHELETLLAELTHEEPEIRLGALRDLSLLGEDEAVEVLEWMLRGDSSPAVRMQAVRELGEMAGENVALALEAGLGDPEAAIRAGVIETMCGLNDDNTLHVMGQAIFGDRDPSVRLAAVNAMAEQSNEAAAAFLAAAAKDRDDTVRKAARRALSHWQ